MSSTKIETPFTPEQVEALNRYQAAGWLHPFTCRDRHGERNHPMDPEGDYGVLVATENGWVCRHCPYTQTWAHGFMAEPLPPNPFSRADTDQAKGDS